jgi:hypothetical protein
VRYSRYEPIPPPFVQSLTTPGPGASVDLLVIRSDRDQTATEFAQRDPRYNPVDRRDLLPPATSLEIAEQHGRLEEADERTLRLVQRAGATDRDPMVPSARRGVPWLPDPASRGIAAYLRPGPGGNEPGPKRDAWTGVWPDVVGKVLELTERVGQDGQLAVDGERVTVRLGQAEQVTLEVSSFLDDDALDDFAIRAWLGAPPPDPTGHDADVMPSDVPPDAVPPETLDLAASGGRHPMVTPPRVLRLVHAVQRPLV